MHARDGRIYIGEGRVRAWGSFVTEKERMIAGKRWRRR
jgi:hypothetical protein